MSGRLRIAAAALAALAVILGCAPKAVRPPAPLELKYKGRPGDSYSYSLAQTFRGRVVNYGMPQLVVVKIKADTEETILEVSENGWMKVKTTNILNPLEVNGMRMEPGGIPVRTETESKRSPSGEVFPAAQDGGPSSDILLWAARSLGSVLPLLPPAPVVPGEKWRRDLSVAAGKTGEFRIVNIGELAGVEEGPEGRVAVIRLEGGVDLAGRMEEGGATIELFRLEYSGTARFDLLRGRIIESKQDGSLAVKGSYEKSSMEARLRFTSVLAPDRED